MGLFKLNFKQRNTSLENTFSGFYDEIIQQAGVCPAGSQQGFIMSVTSYYTQTLPAMIPG